MNLLDTRDHLVSALGQVEVANAAELEQHSYDTLNTEVAQLGSTLIEYGPDATAWIVRSRLQLPCAAAAIKALTPLVCPDELGKVQPNRFATALQTYVDYANRTDVSTRILCALMRVRLEMAIKDAELAQAAIFRLSGIGLPFSLVDLKPLQQRKALEVFLAHEADPEAKRSARVPRIMNGLEELDMATTQAA